MNSDTRAGQSSRSRHGAATSNESIAAALDEAGFNAAVAVALRHYLEPDALRHNPLLWSCLIEAEAGSDREPARRVQILRRIIGAQARRFHAAPKTAILADVLDAAYLKPAVSQTAAATQLGISDRTFRRHSKRAVVLLGAWLWQAELEYQSHHPAPQ